MLLATIWLCSSAQIPTNGLIERFTFDNSLTGSVGTILGTTQGNYVPDRLGTAAAAQNLAGTANSFNGVNIPNLPYGDADRTVSFWYKSNANTTHSLFNCGNSGSNTFAVAYVTGPDRFIISNGSAEYNFPTTYTGNWTHVAVVHNTGLTYLYVNGVQQGSPVATSYNTTTAQLSRMGYSPGGSPYANFQMDDLLLYYLPLTQQQIQGIISGCGPVNTTPAANLAICAGNSTTLTVTGNGTISWYNLPDIGSPLATGTSFTTPVLTETTAYYVESSTDNCSERTMINVTVEQVPTGSITLNNDTIRAANLFDSYILRKDGAIVSSGNTGSFAVPASGCGSYQAEFSNTVNNCNNIGITLTRQTQPCATYLNITNIQFPVTYSFAYGVPAGEPSIVRNTNPITIPTCTNVLLNMRIRSASGCEYDLSFQTFSLTNGPVTLSRPSTSDTLTSCPVFSNIIQINSAGGAPVNTTAAPWLSICSGSSSTLSASGAGTLQWFNTPSGGTVLGTGTSFNTPAITQTTTYYVQAVNNGCISARTAITVNVNPLPATPVNTTPAANQNICSGNSTVLSVAAPPNGISTFWSMLPQGGSSFAVGNSVTIPASSLTATDTFYVGHVNINNNCNSPLIPVIVNVNPTPAAPANTTPQANQSICPGSTTTLSASGTGTLQWYAASAGGNALATGSSFSTPAINTATSYFVAANGGNGCSSARTEVQVQVNPAPPAPNSTTASANLTRCAGNTTTLTATTTFAGAQLKWYDVATGGTSLATGGSFTTPALTATDTFYVAAETSSCPSLRTAIVVTVNPIPTASISPATLAICSGATATLTAGGGGTYAWSNSGGSNAQATFTPAGTTTYTVTVTQNNCTATASAAVTVNALPTAAITPATVSICNGQSAQLTASGGNYTWSNSLGTNATVTVSPTATTNYTVTVTNAGNCSATATRTVTVNTVTAAINGPTTICSGLQAALTASGGSSYAWSNGLGSTAAVTVSPTANTTYTVTVTGAGNCTATASQTVSVQSAPTAVISGNTTICSGESTTLTANGGNTYTWGNGLGTNAAITVSPAANTTYTVTVSIGANCTATATETVTVNQASASSFSQTVCNGESFNFGGNTLTAGGVYYDTLQNTAGCDSIVTLNLNVLPLATATVNAAICTNQNYEFNGQQLIQAGQYFDTLQTQAGCDSFVTLNLNVVNQLSSSLNAAICAGESYDFNGQTLTAAGVYTAILSGTGGCDSVVTLTLTVNALPVPTISANGNILSTQAFDSYQWMLEANDIQGANTQTYTAIQNGNYTVWVSDDNGCEAVSGVYNVTGIGVMDIATAAIKVYPNPAEDVLVVEMPAIDLTKLIITDMEGRVLMEQYVSGKQQLDISNLPAGILNMQFNSSIGIATTKLVKLK